ncbi:helix-turn-helix transcriptional regulator [Oscillospiraceae bacterium PP1C4]
MLGDRLKTLRKSRRMTQQALGEALGVSTSAIGMYEQGRREPDNDTLAALCRLFGVSSDYFLLDGPASEGSSSPAQNADLNDFIDDFRNRLLAQEGLMFNGVPLSDSDIAQVISAIEIGTMVAVNRLGGKAADREES